MKQGRVGALLGLVCASVGCSRDLADLVNAEDLATGVGIVTRTASVLENTPSLEGKLSLLRAGGVAWEGPTVLADDEPWRIALGPVPPGRYELVLELSSAGRPLGALRAPSTEFQVGALNEVVIPVNVTELLDADGDGFFDAEELFDGDPDDSTTAPADVEPPSFGGLTAANGTGPTSVALLWGQASDRHDPPNALTYVIFVAEAGTADAAVCASTNQVDITSEPQGTTVGALADGSSLMPATAYKFAAQSRDTSGNTSPMCGVLIASTTSQNAAPTIVDISDPGGSVGPVVTVDESQLLTLTITASDAEDDPMTISLGLNSLGGQLLQTDATSATFTATPDLAAGGNTEGTIVPYLTEFVVSDGQAVDRRLIQINVRNLNIPPRISAADDLGGCPASLMGETSPPATQDGDVLPTFVVQAQTEAQLPVFGVDCDGDAVTLEVISSPLEVRLDDAVGLPGQSARSTLVVAPQPDQTGVHWVLLRATQPDVPDSTAWVRAQVVVLHHRPPQILPFVPPAGIRVSGVALADVTADPGLETLTVRDVANNDLRVDAATHDGTNFGSTTAYDGTGDIRGPYFPAVGDFVDPPNGSDDLFIIDSPDSPDALIGNYEVESLENAGGTLTPRDVQSVMGGCTPFRSASGNVDGAGLDEVLVACRASTNILRFSFSGMGTIASASNTFLSVPPGDMELWDVDGNGSLDLLTADSGGLDDSGFSVWLNDGAGVFSLGSAFRPQNATGAEALTLADIDGDGDDDALVSMSSTVGSSLQIYSGDGAGNFVPGAASVTTNTFAFLELVDVTDDGIADAIGAASVMNSSVRVFIQARDTGGNPTGDFVPWTMQLLSPSTTYGSIRGAPFGGSEVAIFAGTIKQPGSIIIEEAASFVGVGGPSVVEPLKSTMLMNVPLLSSSMIDVALQIDTLNLDADAAEELLLVTRNSVCTYKNSNLSSAMAFCTSSMTPAVGIDADLLVLGDLDLDQIPEILVYDEDLSALRVLDIDAQLTTPFVAGGATSAEQPVLRQELFVAGGTTRVLLDDFDADGLPDLWAAGDTFQIFRGQRVFGLPSGTFDTTPLFFPVPGGINGAVLADIDANGLRDLVGLAGDASALVALSENGASAVGDGTFTLATLGMVSMPGSCTVNADVRDIRVGNFNTDAAPDVALYVQCAGVPRDDSYAVIMLGQEGPDGLPTGAFSQRGAALLLDDRGGRGAFTDVTGDGALDLVALLEPKGASGIEVVIWENNGRGDLSSGFSEDIVHDGPVLDYSVADFDGDGTLDLLIGFEESSSFGIEFMRANPDNPFGL